METLILGWYVLVETGSVLLLTVFASLLYIGTLVGPLFGVVADRVGHRTVLCAMRAVYALLAAALTALAAAGVLTPGLVLVIAAASGLVRPSDMGMRNAVVGETMPAAQLVAAMGIQRTTQDSARIAGALSGAGLVAALGIAAAYAAVTALYSASVVLTLRAGAASAGAPAGGGPGARASPWADLRAGIAYVRAEPQLLAAICLAFLLNLTAFPLQFGLLPYVAKEIYRVGQTGLGYMVAAAAFGALVGSLVLSRHGATIRPARTMLVACGCWYAMLAAFANLEEPALGLLLLVAAGGAQSASQVPMAALLLRGSDARFRGRVMGLRMLAIYGNLPGLLLAGPLIARFGYPATALFYCAVGLLFVLAIALRWRAALWREDAPANRR